MSSTVRPQRAKVFVSYTAEDLSEHADSVARAARGLGILAVDHRDFAPSGRPSVAECLQRVAECDALVVLVAHRYGWVPSRDDGGDGERSITWLEVEEASRRGLPVLPFLVAKEASWPVQQIEGLRNPAALEGMDRFKELLQRRIVSYFTDAGSLQATVAVSLAELEKRLTRTPLVRPNTSGGTIAAYRQRLERATRHVEMIGFGEQFQVRLPIDEIYVPLRAHVPRSLELRPDGGSRKALDSADAVLRDVALEDAFQVAKGFGLRGVVLLGDPGSGKSTAARRLCWRAADPMQGSASLGLPDDVVPVLLSLRRVRPGSVEQGLRGLARQHLGSRELSDSPHLAEELLGREPILWILDGLDEVADPSIRETVSNWIAEAERGPTEDWFLVTSRYAGYEGRVRLEGAFLELHVQPLDAAQQGEFVSRWYATVERSVRGADARAASRAVERASELINVLRSDDFRSARLASMVSNPLLLSILCIVHRKDVDLPRRRADLYAKCVDVLLESWRHDWRKEQGRALDAGVARLVLEPLAWHLHAAEKRDGSREELLEVVARALATVSAALEVERDAERFLEVIRCDSGLVVSAEPGRYAFLHLTFQEYLAARHAVGAFEPKALAQHYGVPWWSEATLLAAGLATSKPFMEELLDEVLKGDGFEVHDQLSAFLVSEALLLPEEPFLKRLRSGKTSSEKLCAILRLAPPSDAFASAARKLARHDDPRVREAAAGLLLRAGERVPAEARSGAGLEVDLRTRVVFVPIPAGEFEMGGRRHSDEQPTHRVRVESFLLARTPLTNAQYELFMKETGAEPPELWSQRAFNQPDQPVVGVSWEEARAYCKWAGCALPTEAQWEYACRAGTTTEYWSGNSEPDLARVGWYAGNSKGRLHAVAEKEPSPWGLFDMHGNVWEWCADASSSDYSKSQRSHPGAYEESGSPSRVSRGGSFGDSAEFARSAYRTRWGPCFATSASASVPPGASPQADFSSSPLAAWHSLVCMGGQAACEAGLPGEKRSDLAFGRRAKPPPRRAKRARAPRKRRAREREGPTRGFGAARLPHPAGPVVSAASAQHGNRVWASPCTARRSA